MFSCVELEKAKSVSTKLHKNEQIFRKDAVVSKLNVTKLRER